MTQWARNLLEAEPQTAGHVPELRLRWQNNFSGVRLSHGVTFDFQGTSDEDVDLETLWKRLVCHLLIDLLPKRGVEEISAALVQAVDFHTGREAHRLTAPTKVAAAVGRVYEREPFVYSEE